MKSSQRRAMFAKMGMSNVPKHVTHQIMQKHNGTIHHTNPRTRKVEKVMNPTWKRLKNGRIVIIYTGHDGKPVSKIVG